MPVVFTNGAVVECADESRLEELLAAGLKRLVVRRLGPAAVQIDHERLDEVRKLFERLGQTPHITKE